MADDSSDMSVALTAAESAHSLSSDSSEDLGGEQDLGGDPTMMEDEGGVEVEEGHGYVPKSIPGRREKRRLGLRRRERKISVHSDHVKIKVRHQRVFDTEACTSTVRCDHGHIRSVSGVPCGSRSPPRGLFGFTSVTCWPAIRSGRT